MMSKILTIMATCILMFGCDEAHYPIGSLPDAGVNTRIGDTVYVQQYPVWSGFNHPSAILLGNEPFIYVADTYNDRIAMLDLTGRVLGYSKTIKRPIALAEDKTLNLIVCAQFDTLLPGKSTPTTFGAVYKIDMVAVSHSISDGTIRRVFYEPTDSVRRYTGVATLFDNRYYITRTGTKNEVTRVDKDIAVLLFSSTDQLVSPVSNLIPDGTGLLSIHNLTGIATLPTGRSVEFVVSQTGDNCLYKVQWIRLVSEGQTTNYLSKFYPSVDGDIDILRINRFQSPRGVTLDPSGNLFVVDGQTDSLYRFSTRGIERYSFGGTGFGEKQFREPSGVAYYDKTIYVADAGNNRIVRFKLSTDIR
jgi:hypothetical protein